MPQVAVAVATAFMEVAAAVGVPAAATTVVANGILALGGAMGVGSFLSAWGTVASFASMAMAAKVSASSSGGPISLKLDPDAPAPIPFGRTAVGGNVVYRSTFGIDNRFLAVVTVLGICGPHQQIEGFYVNKALETFDAASPYEATGAFVDFMWQQRRLGLTPETAFSWTAADWDGAVAKPTPPGFTAAHKLSGMAALATTYRWKADAKNPRYPSGIPKQYTVGKWVKCWDPRLDSTYPGGSGTQRLANPATWGWTQNGAILALQWLLGWTANGVRVAGVGAPYASIDVAAHVAAANVADTNGWTCGGVATTADDKWEVWAALLQAAGCVPIAGGGLFSCLQKTPRTSTFSITAADLVGAPEAVNSLPYRARFNRVIPKFRSENHSWEIVPGAAISVAAYLATDNAQRRTREVLLPFVQNATQAAQLGYYDLADTREGLVFTLPCGPRLLNARVGDCCTVVLPEIGYASQKCIVIGREHDPASLQVTLTLRSETDAKHALALAQAGAAPPIPSIVPNLPSSISAPVAGDWAIAGTTINNGTDAIPAVVITGACTNEQATAVLFEYKKTADAVWIPLSEQLPTVTRVEITGLAGGVSYDVRSSYKNAWGYYSATTAEGSVVTGSAAVTPPPTYVPPPPTGFIPTTPQDDWTGPPPDVIAF